MASEKPEISFIGLGAMGFGMATNLVKQGYKVTGFDVWKPTLERFAAAGGIGAATPAETVAGKQHCVVMVATGAQAQECLIDGPNAALPALPQGAVVYVCSTVPCAYIQSLAEQLVTLGRSDILLLDAPVSGGVQRAAEGQLSIMVGGTEAALEAGKPLLAEMADSTKLYIVGGIGAGSNMKMCHQVLAAVQILSSSEGMGFAVQLGLDGPSTLEKINASEGAAFMFGHRCPRMFTDFKPVASALTIILKDVGIVTSEARRAGFPVPMVSASEAAYLTGLGLGYGPEDDSVMFRIYTAGKGKVGPVAGAATTDEEKLKLVTALLKGVHLCAAAECLAYAQNLGLDLPQVLDLCTNAAGGSAMLEKYGPTMVKALQDGTAAQGWAPQGGEELASLFDEMKAAVDEASKLKVPLFLGGAAINLMQTALNSVESAATASVVKVWMA